MRLQRQVRMAARLGDVMLLKVKQVAQAVVEAVRS
jgi:hypothetical protein